MRCNLYLLVHKTIHHLGCHRLTHFSSVWVAAMGSSPDSNIAIGQHSNQPLTVANGQRTNFKLTHLLGRFFQGRVRVNNLHLWGHNFLDLHTLPPCREYAERCALTEVCSCR